MPSKLSSGRAMLHFKHLSFVSVLVNSFADKKIYEFFNNYKNNPKLK